MNIDGSVHNGGRADSARGSRAGGEQAEAAQAFGGLFAGLVKATVADEQAEGQAGRAPEADSSADAEAALSAAGPAEAGQAVDEPDLPIWPGLVQEGLPAQTEAQQAAADAAAAAANSSSQAQGGVAQQELSARVDDAAADASLDIATVETGLAEADVVQGETPVDADLRATAEAGTAVLSTAPTGEAPATASTAAQADQVGVAAEQVQRLAAGEGLPAAVVAAGEGKSTGTQPSGRSDDPPKVTGADVIRGDTTRLPATATPAAQAAGEGKSTGTQRSDSSDDPPRATGATVMRGDTTRLPATAAPTAQAAGQVVLPDAAAEMARQQVAELPAGDASEASLLRAAATVDSGRESTSANGLLLNTSPISSPAASRGADMPLPMSTPTPQSVPAEQLAQHAVAVIRQLGDGRSEARIQLHPAELGHLDVELKHDGQRLELSVSVDNEQSRRLVQDQLAQWRERLADSGMNLQSLDVQVRDQNQSSRQDSDGHSEHATSESEIAVNNPASQLIRDPNRSLDIYA